MKPDQKPLCTSVAESLDEYFSTLNGHAPKDLYETILGQVEPPLLRATLRKKLSQYKIAAKAASDSMQLQ